MTWDDFGLFRDCAVPERPSCASSIGATAEPTGLPTTHHQRPTDLPKSIDGRPGPPLNRRLLRLCPSGATQSVLHDLCRPIRGCVTLAPYPGDPKGAPATRLHCAAPSELKTRLLLHEDKVADCIVFFGDSGVSLTTGFGHHLFWIGLPESLSADFVESLDWIAGPHSLVQTDLKWDRLTPLCDA
jgi:hypothetical protein